MKVVFKVGDKRQYRVQVTAQDCATFHGQQVHPVYATFALARDFEWTSRLFFLEMKEADEEGVGTLLTIEHKSMAFVGDEVVLTATVESILNNELICSIEATCGTRLIATGKTGQKMLKQEKLQRLYSTK
ncbi:MAG: hypothetical protein J0L66_00345 [Cytophagales bacterium]|nr:hypothetical protein [Cytophagales bacterium]